MAQELKEKVETLEQTLQNFIRHTNRGFIKLQDTMIEHRQSMEDFKEEMHAYREQSKADIEAYQKRSDRAVLEFRTEMNRKWGELANRLGTLAEDIVAPNIPAIARNYFQCSGEPLFFAVQIKKRPLNEALPRREFDVMAVYENMVFLNETKSTPRQNYLDDFADVITDFADYFPEYASLKLIPVFASLYVDDSIVKYATKKRIYVMAMKGETMALLNFEQLG